MLKYDGGTLGIVWNCNCMITVRKEWLDDLVKDAVERKYGGRLDESGLEYGSKYERD